MAPYLEKPTFFKKNFIESFELLGFLTTVISFFFQYFLLIQNEKFKNDYVYLSWLARCCMYQNLHMRLVHTFSPISPHDFIMPTFSDCFLCPLKGVAQNCGAVGPRFQVSKCTVYHWRPKSIRSSSLAEVAGAGQVQANGFGLLAIEKII